MSRDNTTTKCHRTTHVRAKSQNLLFSTRGCVLPPFPSTRFCPACEIQIWQVGGLKMPSLRNSTFRNFIFGKSVVQKCPACEILNFEILYLANALKQNALRNITFRIQQIDCICISKRYAHSAGGSI